MDDQLRVALLGTRFMGRAHAHAWRSAGAVFELATRPVLQVVAGRDDQATRTFARTWEVARWTTDWRTAVAADDVDLVDVLTPNHLHAEQAIAALEAGHHVACEKPLAGTLADAAAMRDAAAAADRGQRTFVWFSYRRVPAVALAQRLVAGGRIGPVLHVRASYLQSWGGPDTPMAWRFDAELAGSGAHGDLNAHLVDMVRFVTGEEVVEVSGAIEQRFVDERPVPGRPGDTARSTVDDAVLFLARLDGGGVASFEATRRATGVKNRHRLEVHGERGALRLDFERMNELDVFDGDLDGAEQGWRTVVVTHAHHPWTGAWWPDGHGLGYDHAFTNQAADITRLLAGGRPEAPLPDFADAYETQRVLAAAIRSARSRAAVRIEDVP